MSWWYALLGSPVLVAGWPVIKQIFEWWTTRRSENAVHTAKDVYKTLNESQYRLNSDRIMIVSAHNCGGSFRPDCLLYVDCFYEVIADLEPRLSRMVNVRVDSFHIDLLSRLVREGSFWIRVKDMPVNSYMRNMYEADGVELGCLFLIATKDKQVMYGCVHWKKDHIEIAKENDAIVGLKSTLSKLLG